MTEALKHPEEQGTLFIGVFLNVCFKFWFLIEMFWKNSISKILFIILIFKFIFQNSGFQVRS